MALNKNTNLHQCTGCKEELDRESKTLPCLHSFCCSCLCGHFEKQTNENGQCPECYEPLKLDMINSDQENLIARFVQFSLSPFLFKSLKRQQLETTDWKCCMCLKDRIQSIAISWCYDCQELHCAKCKIYHDKFQKKFHSKHIVKDLNGDLNEMVKGQLIKEMMMDMCSTHKKAKDLYCERCHVNFCDTCYQNHLADSPDCSSQPLSVREEALKQKSQGPTLATEMEELEMKIRRVNEMTRNYMKQLNSDCESKCIEVWVSFEKMMEDAKQKTHQLCDKMREMMSKQMERWQQLLEENERILKQLEIWQTHLCHLLSEDQQDVHAVYGLRQVKSNLSSKLQKSSRPEGKCQLMVTFYNWWLQVMEKLKSQEIGLVSLTVEELPGMAHQLNDSANNLTFNKQWNTRQGGIQSIYVNKEDVHVFVVDYVHSSINEFTEWGDFVSECKLTGKKETFIPFDLCSISPDIFVVACGNQRKLVILKRTRNPRSLKIQEIIPTEKKYISLCQGNESFFACDEFFQVDSFTKEWEKRPIKTGEWEVSYPRIHADPSTGNLWGTRINSSEIICFNPNREKIESLKTEEIRDFCVDEFGHFYFCNYDGIFSVSPNKQLWKFEKKPDYYPRIFVLKNKIFVSLRIDGNDLIKIFKIPDRK